MQTATIFNKCIQRNVRCFVLSLLADMMIISWIDWGPLLLALLVLAVLLANWIWRVVPAFNDSSSTSSVLGNLLHLIKYSLEGNSFIYFLHSNNLSLKIIKFVSTV
jgi:hypothetical protein